MTKLDLIKLIIETDDKVFEELAYAKWDKEFFEKILLLANKIYYVGDIDKIGLIEIDNEYIYVEPKPGYVFTSLDSYKGKYLDYRLGIKKVD